MSDRITTCAVFNFRALVTHCAAVVAVSHHRRCKPKKAIKAILVWIESCSYSVYLSLLALILTNQSIYWFLLDGQYSYHVNFVIISSSGVLLSLIFIIKWHEYIILGIYITVRPVYIARRMNWEHSVAWNGTRWPPIALRVSNYTLYHTWILLVHVNQIVQIWIEWLTIWIH